MASASPYKEKITTDFFLCDKCIEKKKYVLKSTQMYFLLKEMIISCRKVIVNIKTLV